MDECIISLDKLGIENRRNDVFYACSDFIIYRDKSQLCCDDCSGDTFSSIPCPYNVKGVEFCESGEDLVFMLSGKTLVIKTGDELHEKKIPFQRTGRGVTQLISPKPDHIIFGSVNRGQIQFVNYDYKKETRVAQTSSWSMNDITDFNWTDEHIFAIFDKSYIVACKQDTCEVEWHRFESGQVNGDILSYEKHMIYACEKNLKIIDRSGKAETVRIPLVKIHHLEHIVGHNLYFTSQAGKNLCCYNLHTREMTWEIPGKYTVHETLLVKGRGDTGVDDVMILRLDDHIAVVNLRIGKSLYYLKVTNINRIRKTGDHVLLHRTGGLTGLLPGSSV